jgi:hypothetical protein
MGRVDVGATIEQEPDNGARRSDDSSVKRRCSGAITEVQQRGICAYERAHALQVACFGCEVNRMIDSRRARADPALTLPPLFDECRDILMAAITRHLRETAVVESVPLRVRARVEEQPRRFEVTFARREVNGRGVPVLRGHERRLIV